ncbi:hypothetical protein D3C71_1946810 [compost metagenome]
MTLNAVSPVQPDIAGQPVMPPAAEHHAFSLQPPRAFGQLRADQSGDMSLGIMQYPGIG